MSNKIDDDRIRTLVRFVWRNHSVNCVTTIAKSLIEVYKTFQGTYLFTQAVQMKSQAMFVHILRKI